MTGHNPFVAGNFHPTRLQPGANALAAQFARYRVAVVGVNQHLVPLAGLGHQPKYAAGTQLHVRHLDAVVDASHHQTLFALVKLEHLTQVKLQRCKELGKDTPRCQSALVGSLCARRSRMAKALS